MADKTELSARIEIIERGYEYLLAYAAQGRQNEQGSEARQRLSEMFEALNGLHDLVAGAVNGSGQVAQAAPFVEAMKQDAAKAARNEPCMSPSAPCMRSSVGRSSVPDSS